MNLHVVLDYYDVPKLEKLSNKSALLTTLFQSSGKALGQQGFINVTDLSSGEIAFGSAVKGSSLDATLVRLVVSQPYNISVLQISSLIKPEGISGLQGLSSVKLVAASNKSSAPVPSKAPSPSGDSSAPTLAPNAPAPKGSGCTRVGLGLFSAVFMVFVSSLVAL